MNRLLDAINRVLEERHEVKKEFQRNEYRNNTLSSTKDNNFTSEAAEAILTNSYDKRVASLKTKLEVSGSPVGNS